MSNFGDTPSDAAGRELPAKAPDAKSQATTKNHAHETVFEHDWRSIEPAIYRMLVGCGCPPCDRDDIVQEVAIRLLSTTFSYQDPADLRRYAVRIAKNLYIDGLRKRQLATVELGRASDVAGPDLAATVEQRLALRAVGRGWSALSPAEKALLESDGRPVNDRTLANRQKVQRHRLRGRLKQLTIGLIGAATAMTIVPAGHASPAMRTQRPIPASHTNPGSGLGGRRV